MRRILLAAGWLTAWYLAPPAQAADPPCEFRNVDRVVAVGDVHGAYERLVAILRAAEVVDARARWIGGRTHLVQLGDVVDRGPDSRKALDLLQQIERDAPKTGGRVHPLLGNHEAMRLLGDARYVTPGEYAAFRTPESEALRRQVMQEIPSDLRERVLEETPPGRIELLRAFGPGGSYGNFLRRLNAVVRINGVLFLHGGISPAFASLPCAEINGRLRQELSSDLDKTKAAPERTLAADPAGPLWYRGLAEEPGTFAPALDAILTAQRAIAMVVAHTVRTDGRVAARFGGRVFVIDTGMQPDYVASGAASALELRGGRFTAIYTDRKEVVGTAPPAGR